MGQGPVRVQEACLEVAEDFIYCDEVRVFTIRIQINKVVVFERVVDGERRCGLGEIFFKKRGENFWVNAKSFVCEWVCVERHVSRVAIAECEGWLVLCTVMIEVQ